MEFKQTELDDYIISLGYKMISKETWSEHCEKCNSHDINGCGKLMPNCHEFFDCIVFQKNIGNKIVEIARPKKEYSKKVLGFISEYRIGFVYHTEYQPQIVRRFFWELLKEEELPVFIPRTEYEISRLQKHIDSIYNPTNQ